MHANFGAGHLYSTKCHSTAVTACSQTQLVIRNQSHSSHLLRLVDVDCFGPYKQVYLQQS
ncbi:hypothetical protein M433DRAFT_76744 [Acidomyces richmondensis BFW]|nr:hypothetical protein M433DRAFT_76744 [Acidomyces richmondensis BFW]